MWYCFNLFCYCVKYYSIYVLKYLICDTSRVWELYFQDSASPQREAHNVFMYYLAAIFYSIGWIQEEIIRNLKISRSLVSNKYLNHGTLIELIWTIISALILA